MPLKSLKTKKKTGITSSCVEKIRDDVFYVFEVLEDAFACVKNVRTHAIIIGTILREDLGIYSTDFQVDDVNEVDLVIKDQRCIQCCVDDCTKIAKPCNELANRFPKHWFCDDHEWTHAEAYLFRELQYTLIEAKIGDTNEYMDDLRFIRYTEADEGDDYDVTQKRQYIGLLLQIASGLNRCIYETIHCMSQEVCPFKEFLIFLANPRVPLSYGSTLKMSMAEKMLHGTKYSFMDKIAHIDYAISLMRQVHLPSKYAVSQGSFGHVFAMLRPILANLDKGMVALQEELWEEENQAICVDLLDVCEEEDKLEYEGVVHDEPTVKDLDFAQGAQSIDYKNHDAGNHLYHANNVALLIDTVNNTIENHPDSNILLMASAREMKRLIMNAYGDTKAMTNVLTRIAADPEFRGPRDMMVIEIAKRLPCPYSDLDTIMNDIISCHNNKDTMLIDNIQNHPALYDARSALKSILDPGIAFVSAS